MMPSNWDQELDELRKSICQRLNAAAVNIVAEEISKILGRVKIYSEMNLNNGQYSWFIEQKASPEERK